MQYLIIILALVIISVVGFMYYRLKVQRAVATRTVARRMVCATNMKSLGKSMLIYANDYDDNFPTPSKWCDLLIEHAEVTERSLRCRGASEGPCNYAMNKNLGKMDPHSPPDMVVLFETHPGWNQSGGPEILTTDNHQGKGCNVLFFDSHVEFVKTEDLDDLKWNIANH